jgi:hypothetical protein
LDEDNKEYFVPLRTISLNRINVMGRDAIINAARTKYNSYDLNKWERAYFDKDSGGYNVYHKRHNFSKKGGGGDAEKTVGKMLAQYNGKQVEFLPEDGFVKSSDVRFDELTWDIKYIEKASEHTIRDHINDARKADNAIFYFTTDQYLKLNNAIIREVGRHTKLNRLHKLPNICYIDPNGLLVLLWSK